MKKKHNRANLLFLAICVITIIFSVYATPLANASYRIPEEACSILIIKKDKEQISPQTEQTTWYYRTYNGHVQKRLWSNTNEVWLTDWIDC